MSLRDNTKHAFANALKKMLLTKDLPKVRVKEICDLCGAERPTFYYHFQDKYDLILWIYEQDLKKSLEASDGYYSIYQLEHLLTTMQKEKVFYQKVFADDSPNSLHLSIFKTNHSIFTDILKKSFQVSFLGMEQEFSINFYIHAWIGCLYDWINQKYDISAKEYAYLMYHNIQHFNFSTVKAADYDG